MEFARLPRFERASGTPPIQLTERDLRIIQLVYKHRFLRSSQIVALLGGCAQPVIRRLQLLYHHGYLERPRSQLDYYQHGGSRAIVYGLGNKGAAVLKQGSESGIFHLRWGEKNRAVGRPYLEHVLLVSEIMVSIELACRKTGVRLLNEPELEFNPTTQLPQGSFRWQVSVDSQCKLGVVPDRVFALEFHGANGARNRAHFFLEADRGTMPVIRKNLSQTSIFRKLLAYQSTWAQDLYQRQFGFNRVRVLFVTKSQARTEAMIDACQRLEHGQGLFLFADTTILQNPESILTVPCQTSRGGQFATFLD